MFFSSEFILTCFDWIDYIINIFFRKKLWIVSLESSYSQVLLLSLHVKQQLVWAT